MTEIRGRVQALDRLRGLIVALMALDHARNFVAQAHSSGEYWGGFLPVYPTVWAFLTRLATHLAAPGFFFLVGAGMALFSLKRDEEGWNKAEIRRHFLLRGALLILLQLLVVNRAWELSPGGWGLTVYIGVLTALGGAMIVSAWLVVMRPALLFVLAAIPIAATELITPSPAQWGHAFNPLLRLLLIPGGTQALWVNYPLLSREEEAVLTRRAVAGDQAAKEKLIRSNLRFVVAVAKRYRNKDIPLLDLINQNNIGLLKAIKKLRAPSCRQVLEAYVA